MMRYFNPSDLQIQLTAEDIEYAVKQDRFACAIVRAIQREIPAAIIVRADAEKIAFSLQSADTRFYYNTPKVVIDKIIEPLDKGYEVKPQKIRLSGPTAKPMVHMTPELKQTLRMRKTTKKLKGEYDSTPQRIHNRFCDPVELTETLPAE